MSLPGRLGRYDAQRLLGSGGFATVWLGYDEHLDSAVAIKVLADNWAQDGQVRRRFVEEGRYLRRVDSPHVVSVHDAGELDDGRPYLVMTYADQGTLADRLAAAPLSPGQVLTVVRQIAEGLQALHDRDIVHRDVKPANVLFKTAGQSVRAMLGDLGLGKSLDASSRLTMIAGTPWFVAPEQAAAESPDARADQYSLAALAYLLLTGRPPYDHASLRAAAESASPPALPEPFPPAASEVVRRALARDRDERWPSVTDFADALTDALGTPPEPLLCDPQATQATPAPAGRPTARATAPPPGRRRRWWPWLVAGVVLAAAGVAAGWAMAPRAPETTTVTDDEGTLSVTVPTAWDRTVSTAGWQPPTDEASETTYPALSVGTARDWQGSAGQGVFAGILPGDKLPQQVPQHPECERADEPLPDRSAAGDEMVTVVFTGCPGGVTVERVVQVTDNRLLWVQVRSDSRMVANRVLDALQTHGI
ncbi:protein kinase domain-containing protein [Nocardioides sp.]|uniref:serine/threonine-protein kinase n=1 Tax=Nocardioides sp. TaxID=35761 RepID=UPI0039E34A91